jgi:hypothetical protein
MGVQDNDLTFFEQLTVGTEVLVNHVISAYYTNREEPLQVRHAYVGTRPIERLTYEHDRPKSPIRERQSYHRFCVLTGNPRRTPGSLELPTDAYGVLDPHDGWGMGLGAITLSLEELAALRIAKSISVPRPSDQPREILGQKIHYRQGRPPQLVTCQVEVMAGEQAASFLKKQQLYDQARTYATHAYATQYAEQRRA